MEFTRDTIIEALTELGEALWRRKKIADISIFGGSAMILQFDVSFVTQDIDAVIESEHGEVMRLVQDIARRRSWNTTWLNEGVSVYLSPVAGRQTVAFGAFPSAERCGLRVYISKPEYLLALKLRALRVGSRDFDDAVMLARHLGVKTAGELSEIVATHFPREPLDERRRLLVESLSAELGD